jgi:quinol monooxygenase YgiN
VLQRHFREEAMPVIVFTRLKLKDPAHFEEFFAAAVAVAEQAKRSQGNLGADFLADADQTSWTVTAWETWPLMQSFVMAEPHLGTMTRIDDWCDEASFVDWEQENAELPRWQDGYRRLVATGKPTRLSNPTVAHATLDFPRPSGSS